MFFIFQDTQPSPGPVPVPPQSIAQRMASFFRLSSPKRETGIFKISKHNMNKKIVPAICSRNNFHARLTKRKNIFLKMRTQKMIEIHFKKSLFFPAFCPHLFYILQVSEKFKLAEVTQPATTLPPSIIQAVNETQLDVDNLVNIFGYVSISFFALMKIKLSFWFNIFCFLRLKNVFQKLIVFCVNYYFHFGSICVYSRWALIWYGIIFLVLWFFVFVWPIVQLIRATSR